MLYILTGNVQSGKTTALINWSANRNDVWGILTPVVNGKRVFMDAATKEQFPMEADATETATIPVGRFTFSKNNFDKAIQIIAAAIYNNGWLIIDEIGPLELRGQGFATVLNDVLKLRKEKIILVVREGLAEKVAAQFDIGTSLIHPRDVASL